MRQANRDSAPSLLAGDSEHHHGCWARTLAARRNQRTDGLLTGAGVARLLKVGETTIGRWRKSGRLPKPVKVERGTNLWEPEQVSVSPEPFDFPCHVSGFTRFPRLRPDSCLHAIESRVAARQPKCQRANQFSSMLRIRPIGQIVGAKIVGCEDGVACFKIRIAECGELSWATFAVCQPSWL